MTFSPETLGLFAQLLERFTLPSTHPQLAELAAMVVAARTELAEALASSTPAEPPS